MIEITILGTASAIPTKERNVAGIFLKYKGKGILFDCGEGTQRQMELCGIKRTDVELICLTHWHGDHMGGLLPLLQTIGNSEEQKKIHLLGPKGTKKHFEHLMESCVFDSEIEFVVEELNPRGVKTVVESEEFMIEAAPLEHATPCLGYSFIEKERRNINKEKMAKLNIPDGPHCKLLKEGKDAVYALKKLSAKDLTYMVDRKKFTYITDTMFCQGAIDLAQEADILLCEATFANEHQSRAKESMHMIAEDAAKIAQAANVKKLILTHFSRRYTNTQQIEQDARDVFDNVECAKDFMRFSL